MNEIEFVEEAMNSIYVKPPNMDRDNGTPLTSLFQAYGKCCFGNQTPTYLRANRKTREHLRKLFRPDMFASCDSMVLMGCPIVDAQDLPDECVHFVNIHNLTDRRYQIYVMLRPIQSEAQ